MCVSMCLFVYMMWLYSLSKNWCDLSQSQYWETEAVAGRASRKEFWDYLCRETLGLKSDFVIYNESSLKSSCCFHRQMEELYQKKEEILLKIMKIVREVIVNISWEMVTNFSCIPSWFIYYLFPPSSFYKLHTHTH